MKAVGWDGWGGVYGGKDFWKKWFLVWSGKQWE